MITETIAAIATPPGRGGVGIIRVSGPLASSIGLKLSNKKTLSTRVMIHTSFISLLGEIIDKGLLVYFEAPNSFTGEDILEFHGHGSPLILDLLLKECLACGARTARPGEFSERAFLNNKMDLTQAEAIADLIQASSLMAARMAVRSLQGDFSIQVNQISEQIIQLRLYVEAAIDFPEEEVDFLNDGNIATRLDQLIHTLVSLRANASQGAMLREGLSLVIAGRPNAGKSSLINRLSGREIAIVTEIPGTTRDVMREQVLIDDLPVHLIDTAGLRDSDDPVEKEGIKRAWQEVRQADCVLMIIDVNKREESHELSTAITTQLPPGVPLLKIYNKIDSLNKSLPYDEQAVYLSAKSGEGLPELKSRIKSLVGYQPVEGQFLARRRHLDALDKTLSFLKTGQQQLMETRAGELVAEDLRCAHEALCEITGEFTSDDLLGEIFSSFCIGK